MADDPREWNVQQLASALGFSAVADLSDALGSINTFGYRLFVLDQGRKKRVIASPRDWLKRLQRRANESLLANLPISSVVYSRPGRSVVQNARQHLHRRFMTVLDVADCFPSTSMSMVRRSLEGMGLREDVAGALTRLTTFRGFLQQGPPTSPAIQNVVFRPIDDALLELANSHSASYTRYGDDMAFSSDQPLHRLDRRAVRVLRRFGYGTNEAKCHVWGPSDRHTLTKIVVNSSLSATPEYLKSLGKLLSALRSGDCRLTDDQIRGKIAWVSALDPDLGRLLERRRRLNASYMRDSGAPALTLAR